MYQTTTSLTILRERRARRAQALRLQRRLQFELDRDLDRNTVRCIVRPADTLPPAA